MAIEMKASDVKSKSGKNFIRTAPDIRKVRAVRQYANSVLSLARWVLVCAK